MITSSFSLSARCFLFSSLFLSSADISCEKRPDQTRKQSILSSKIGKVEKAARKATKIQPSTCVYIQYTSKKTKHRQLVLETLA